MPCNDPTRTLIVKCASDVESALHRACLGGKPILHYETTSQATPPLSLSQWSARLRPPHALYRDKLGRGDRFVNTTSSAQSSFHRDKLGGEVIPHARDNLNASLNCSRRPQPAFTLVELLVVIAIIGVLVALLLPAVQAAREAARRVSCANNITQLNLAVHNFEFHYEHMPAGVINPDGPIRSEPQGIHVSWIVQILPYLEQQPLSRRFDSAAGAYADKNAQVRAARINPLLCASNPGPYVNEAGTIAHSSYAGCHHDMEAPIDKDNHGLLFLNSKIRYAEIHDGSSMTILLAEALTGPDSLGWVSGTRATLRNTGSIEQPEVRLPASQQTPEKKPSATFVGGFGSYHPGGINAGFADGSTRFLSQNTALDVLKQLGNRSDGEIMKPF